MQRTFCQILLASLAPICVYGFARADDFAITGAARKHWSFQPVKRVQAPTVSGDDAAWAKTDVDQFLAVMLKERGLKPVAPADKRTLIRRATFDLTGLPPTPEDIDAFVDDTSADAYPRLIEGLLASNHYGARWGRHWLDLVRYADTAGETADFPARFAWRYRNYVIDAFNKDKPYDRFVREQLAGDILASKLGPGASREQFAELVTATGYIAIAKRFGAVIERDHYLTIEDTIDTVSKSLLGLTVACARCHDHKYDPVSVRDYYALYGIFDSTRYPYPGCEIINRPRDMVPLMPPAERDRQVRPHEQKLEELNAALNRARSEMTAASQRWMQSLDLMSNRTEMMRGQIDNLGKDELPSRVGALSKPFDVAKGDMIQLTLFAKADSANDHSIVELRIKEKGGQNREWATARDMALDLLAGNPHPDREGANPALWWIMDVSGPRPTLLNKAVKDVDERPGLTSWGELTAPPVAVANSTRSYVVARGAGFMGRSFAMHPPTSGGGVAVAWVSPFDGAVEISGYVADADHQGGDGVAWVLEQIKPGRREFDDEMTRAAAVLAEARRVRDAHVAAGPKIDLAYAVAESVPHDVPIQIRGDEEKPGPLAPRRFLEILGGQKLPAGSGSGRLELADWIVSTDNPLAARVMVNRIWQHHFGRGIVKTSSDFGTRGEPPTHPELLDYLAARFVHDKWSIKNMHRLIMFSGAYQLSSADDSDALRADPSNALHWRFDRRRLGAEEIRDTLLAVSGDLDTAPGGAHPFPSEETWSYTQHNPFAETYETNKRSVYVMTQRIKRNPFFALFDGADPGATTAERLDTTVPTQSLFFMNDPFVFARSESLANALLKLPDDAVRLSRAYRACFGRGPTAMELEQAAAFLRAYAQELSDVPTDQRLKAAWSAYVRALFGSNEMLFVD